MPKVSAAATAPALCQEKQISWKKTGVSDQEPYDTDYICEPVEYQDALAFFAVEQKDLPEDGVHDLVSSFELTAITNEAGRIFQTWGRAKIEEVVERGLHDEAAKILRSKREPLQRLKRLVVLLQTQNVPMYEYLANETCDVVQAVQYYNHRIHAQYKASGELAPNPAIIVFPPQALHLLTPAIHHTLVCISLNHYLHSQSIGADRAAASINRSKIYHHRGEALRALSQYIGQDKTRCSDMTITSILMFMCLELQNPTFTDWRSHVNGMKRLIDLRGGPKQLIHDAPHLVASLVLYLLIISIANTCSPPWDQVDMTGVNDTIIDDVSSMYDLIFPYTLCPRELFVEILQINQLRTKASAAMLLFDIDPVHALEAQDLVVRIEAFSPEAWAQAGTLYSEWLMVGSIYKAAVSLYCTLSLQSLTILPPTVSLHRSQTGKGDLLLSSVRCALQTPRIARHMVWPLVVAGVEAIHRSEATKRWIEASLQDLSRLLGTSCPLKACAVLKRYWKGGVAGWDECFDRAYVFII